MSKRNTKSSGYLPGLLSVWKRLTHNWILKILCLGMAFVVWQSVRENTSSEVMVSDIPVTVTVSEGRAVVDQSVKTVNIRFRGASEDTSFLNKDRVRVQVDLIGRIDRSRQTIKLSPRHVNTPSRAHAVQFIPPEIIITVDREVESVVPVKAQFAGTLPPGVQLDKIVCTPAVVKVRGAEQLLSELEQVKTVPISFDGRNSSFQEHVAIDAVAQPWVVSPDHVAVDAILVERVKTRRIENSEVRPMLASDDTRVVKVRPATVAVTLRGSPQQIDALNERDVYTYVDCTDLTDPADYEVSVRADLPVGLQVEKIEPAAVQVTVKKM